MNFLSRLWFELKVHFRSLLFWVGFALVMIMVYSEVIDPMRSLPEMVARIRENQDLFGGYSQRYVEIAKNGLTSEYFQTMAGTLADRLSIVLSLVTVFVVGFVLQREKTALNREPVYTAAISGWKYILEKYLGAVLALLFPVGVSLFWALVQCSITASRLGGTFTLEMFLRPLGWLLLPTLIYVAALVLFAAVTLDRPAAVVPLYFLYFYFTFRPEVTAEGNVNFPLNLGTFITRWEGHGTELFADEFKLLLLNRQLYLGLSIVLLLGAVAAYRYRRSHFAGRVSA